MVVWSTDSPRSAMISSRSRRLSENRKYHRTQVMITSGSNWRFRKALGRDGVMPSPYQTCRCNTSFQSVDLEGNDRKVRRHSKIHLPDGSIPRLGGEDMMFHGLDVAKATFQWAGGSKCSRSCDATSEFHCLYRAAHRLGTCKQQIRLLLQ